MGISVEKVFKLKKCCNNCPFKGNDNRSTIDAIMEDLLKDDYLDFYCHKTVYGKNYTIKKDEKKSFCYGAMVELAKRNRPSVSMRLANAMGIISISKMQSEEI